MKRLISIAFCAFMIAAAVPAEAQQRERRQQENNRQTRTPEEMAKVRADRLKEQLDLDDEQYAKVLELNQEQMKNRTVRTGSDKPSDEEMAKIREEMSAAREKYQARMKEILTPEQFAKYEESMKNSPGMGMGGNRGGGRPAQKN